MSNYGMRDPIISMGMQVGTLDVPLFENAGMIVPGTTVFVSPDGEQSDPTPEDVFEAVSYAVSQMLGTLAAMVESGSYTLDDAMRIRVEVVLGDAQNPRHVSQINNRAEGRPANSDATPASGSFEDEVAEFLRSLGLDPDDFGPEATDSDDDGPIPF